MSVFDDIKRAVTGQKAEQAKPMMAQSDSPAADTQTPQESFQETGQDAAHAYTSADGNSQALGEYDGRKLHATFLAAVQAQRDEKDHAFRHDPGSPVGDGFDGLRYYDPDPAFQFTLALKRATPDPVTFQTSSGAQQRYNRIGTVQFEVEGQPAELAIFQTAGSNDLFLPFRDATSGTETYGAGRYLEPIALGKDQLLVDFNLAYNPYCAYSPDFSCPLPPIENWLKVPIRAGEMAFEGNDGEPH